MTCVLVVAASLAFLPRIERKMADFEVYWRVGARVVAAEPIYRADDGHFQHKYLPAFGFVVAPLALLPLTPAKVVWFYLILASIAALVGLSAAELRFALPGIRELPRGRWGAVPLIAVAVGIEAKFFAHELTMGQCNALMALVVIGAFAALRRGRPVAAGWLLALAIVVKPYPVIFLPYLVLTKRWRVVASCVIGVGVALVLPSVVYGIEANAMLLREWLRTIGDSTAPNLLNQDNVSVWAMWAKWLRPGPIATGLAAATLFGLACGVWGVVARGAGKPGREYLEMGLLLTLIPLCSPQGWDYGLLSSTPAVLLLLSRYRSLQPGWQVASAIALAGLALSAFDVMGREGYAAFMALSVISVCAMVVIGALARLRLSGLA